MELQALFLPCGSPAEGWEQLCVFFRSDVTSPLALLADQVVRELQYLLVAESLRWNTDICRDVGGGLATRAFQQVSASLWGKKTGYGKKSKPIQQLYQKTEV